MTATTVVLLASMLFLLLTLALGLVRAMIGPGIQDRMLSIQLLGTCGVAMLLLMATTLAAPALIDVALVLTLLAVVAAAAMTQIEADDD